MKNPKELLQLFKDRYWQKGKGSEWVTWVASEDKDGFCIYVNPDLLINVSLFEAGNYALVTFSPDTGSRFKEKKFIDGISAIMGFRPCFRCWSLTSNGPTYVWSEVDKDIPRRAILRAEILFAGLEETA